MLKLDIPTSDVYNEDLNEFITIEATTLYLEHSLISISKWESIYHKAFLTNKPKTNSEIIGYIKCMTIKPVKDDNVYYCLSSDNLKKITDYIDDSMTATSFFEPNRNGRSSRNEIMTSEVIYYYMISLNIPIECEKWHINRLLTLIKVFSVKNAKDSKRYTDNEIRQMNKEMNAARRAKYNSKG